VTVTTQSSHDHPQVGANADRRWLSAALVVLVVFMFAEVVAGVLAHSLALISDAGHLLTDVAALVTALVAARIAMRPARGSFTYGFARVDALAGQANGITLVVLAAVFTVGAVDHLVHPPKAAGSVMAIVAGVGVAMNVLATFFAKKADSRRLSVRGAVSHLVNDAWAFLATAIAGVVIIATGWTRADAIASLCIAVLMAVSGLGLIRTAGRVFLEAAPPGVDPDELGADLAEVDGVAQIHDLHVWQLGPGEDAISAHVFVKPQRDCHQVAESLRQLLADDYHLRHVTLQVDHADESSNAQALLDHCDEPHGPVHRPIDPTADVNSGLHLNR
jgi:cobalt-zinc-cadmium efflux system protein